MASSFLLLTSVLLLSTAPRGDGRAVFAGVSFESPGEAEAFEDALLRQACFNVSVLPSSGGGRQACVPRLDTARGGAGSGPVPVLRAALRGTLGEAVGAAGAVGGLASLSNHAREEMAVRDCVELLGYSVDELGAALGNQDTCLEGFRGTDGRLLRRVEAAVAQLSQLVSNLLAMHRRLRSITPPLHHAPPRNNGTGGGGDPGSELPPWVMDIEGGGGGRDEELLLKRARGGGKSTRVDVVVAQDGSGRYRTVSDAVARAPSHSKRKY
ncbi:pectinesterase [Panicum miliaceum]|uniref:Pectinesterase n=1 Tax=Panicum miliaceum TaxID=4540 RepID=A0A3L6SGE3_PANMI|nr:pectinesterase [Panicum miliaceum]